MSARQPPRVGLDSTPASRASTSAHSGANHFPNSRETSSTEREAADFATDSRRHPQLPPRAQMAGAEASPWRSSSGRAAPPLRPDWFGGEGTAVPAYKARASVAPPYVRDEARAGAAGLTSGRSAGGRSQTTSGGDRTAEAAFATGILSSLLELYGTERGGMGNTGMRRRRTESSMGMERKRTVGGKGDGTTAAGEKSHRPEALGRDPISTSASTSTINGQAFILKLAQALMTFGAPSHRLESHLSATASVLSIPAQFLLPSLLLASFADPATHTSSLRLVKASGRLNLGSLQRVHDVYAAVVARAMTVEDGDAALGALLRAKPIYGLWRRMGIGAVSAGIICPMGFGGSAVDALVAGGFGATLTFLQLYVARRNLVFANIFEISAACLFSFIARGLSTTQLFCYQSLASAGVVLVLPGYLCLAAALELASRNLVSGAVRLVYVLFYVATLGFAISIGSDAFFLLAPGARHARDARVAAAEMAKGFEASGVGVFAGGGVEQVVRWTFSNVTTVVDVSQASLQRGKVMCVRDPSWEWWRSPLPARWLFPLMPAYALSSSLWNLQPLRSRHLPAMVAIAYCGYTINRFANAYIFDRSDVVSFLGATAVGLLGHLYARAAAATSFVAMAPGVLVLVPGGIAAAGGLAAHGKAGYAAGLEISMRMVHVAIGITTGLFFSSFLIHSVATKRANAGLGFAF